jgi:mgtE-like transporter
MYRASVIIRESFPILLFLLIFSLITGRTLEEATHILVDEAPFIFLVIPAFINMAGVLATVFSSRLTSRLFIGTIDRRFRPRLLAFDLLSIAAVAFTGFLLLALTIILVTKYLLFIATNDVALLYVFLTAGLTATISMCTVGIIVAYVSFSKGLNPDNFTAPFTSTLGDMVGTLILIFAVRSFLLV